MSIPILSGLGDALNFYQQHVSDPISGSILLGLNSGRSALGLGNEGTDTLSSFGSGLPGSNPSQALNYAYQDNPLGRFAFQTATDPLTYLGTGAFPAAAKALGMGGRALDFVNFTDKVPGLVTNNVLDTIGSKASQIGMPLAAKAEPYVAGFADAHPGLSSAWQSANFGIKELTHLIPGYFLGNMSDDASRQALFGDAGTAGEMLKNQLGATKNYMTGSASDNVAPNAAQFLENFGGELPKDVSETGVASVGPESAFRRFQSRAPTGQFDQYGNEITAPTIKNTRDQLLDLISRPGEYGKGLEQAQEVAGRSTVWGNKAKELLGQPAQQMSDWLSSHGMNDIASDLVDQGGMMSPSELRERMIDAGMSDRQATGAASQYWDQANAVRDPATDWLNKTQYQYNAHPINDLIDSLPERFGGTTLDRSLFNPRTGAVTDRNAILNAVGGDVNATDFLYGTTGSDGALAAARGEQLLRGLAQNTFGGYKFATQNVPTFLRLAGEHPGIANTGEEYYRDSDIYNAMHGLGSEFHGAMPVANIGGHEIYLDPGRLNSFLELMGDASKSDDKGLIGDLGAAGLGFNPLIRAGLQVLGDNGDYQMSNVLQPTNLINGVGSLISGHPVDVEQPIKAGLGIGQQALTGEMTFPFTSHLVRQRQAELAGGYDRFQADNPSPAIADQAQRDVANEQGARSLLSALTGLGLETESPEQALINHNSAVQNYRAQYGLSTLNPTQDAYTLADPLAAMVYHYPSLSIQQKMELLRDPRAVQMLQRSLTQHAQSTGAQLHGTPPPLVA